MQLRGLRTGQFRVEDIAAARDWYAELVGIAPYFEESFYVGFEIGGYELGLAPGQAGIGGSVFYWATEDPAAFVERAVAMGATRHEPVRDVGDGIVVGTFIDPFGNEFGVIRNPHFAPQLVEAKADDVSGRTITYSVEVPVSPTEAWNLWATSDGLARWWTEHTRVDLRPGGHYEIHFDPDAAPGDKGGDWCRVLSFLPGRMLSFTWNAPPHLKTRPLHTWVVLLFEASDTGCRVELNHHGWPASGMGHPASDWPDTYDYFENAWRDVMDLFLNQLEAA